jgi:threonine/homoserine efflux transporter RhtA
MIYATVPITAGLIGWVILGERISWSEFVASIVARFDSPYANRPTPFALNF